MDAVYRLTFAILGNQADATDAAQETFVAAWRQIGRLRYPDRFEAWLQRMRHPRGVNGYSLEWRNL